MVKLRAIVAVFVLVAISQSRVFADVPVVVEETARAVVVTPDAPSAVVRYAAKELGEHVEKATGIALPVVTESEARDDLRSRIYLGDCRAARAARISPRELEAETFILRTTDGALFITGNDGNGDPLNRDTSAGTLFGV